MTSVVPGRFHVVTNGLAAMLRAAPGPAVVVLCAADRSGTRRNPLAADVREQQILAVRPDASIVRLPDLTDDARWVDAVLASVPAPVCVVTANRDLAPRFQARGVAVSVPEVTGPTPFDVLDDLIAGRPWESSVPPAIAALLAPEVEAIRAVAARALVNPDGELAHARDFDSYGAQMDAALAQKLADLLPWVVPGCIVDKGCGTGKLLVELSRLYPESAFVGVDLSKEFLRRCDENTYLAGDVAFVQKDARDPAVADGTATTIVLSSIVHEIWTYTGYSQEAVDRALASAFQELAPGGRLVVRDGVSPGRQPWRMRFLRPDVRACFERFAREFKHGQGAAHTWDGDDVVLSAHHANEFLCKKDYQKNWHIEVHEEFGTFSLDEWKAMVERHGFRLRELHGYVNGWIAANRYEGAVALFDAAGDPLPWPATNVVVVAERVVA